MDLQFSPLEKTNHLTTVLGTAWLYFAACRPQMAIYPRLVICAIGPRFYLNLLLLHVVIMSKVLNINYIRGQHYVTIIFV